MSTLLRLEVFHQGELLKEIPWEGETLWVGRGEECGIRLDDRAISRKHAVIRNTENGIEFEKKSKFGGAKIDGRDVEQLTLHGGECLVFGEYEIHFKKPETSVSPKPAGIDPPLESPGGELRPDSGTSTAILSGSPEELAALPEIQSEPALADGGVLLESAEGSGGNDFLEAVQSSPEGEPGAEAAAGAADPFAVSGSGTEAGGQTGAGTSSSTAQFNFSTQQMDGATRVSKRDLNQTKPVLEFGDPENGGRIYDMQDEEISIGRAPNCHVILEDKKSSRKHVVIVKRDSKWVLKDQGSANGTLVNGTRVDEHELTSGDEILIGDTRFKFKIVQADFEEKKAAFLQVPVEEVPLMPAYPSAPPPNPIQPFESFVPGDVPAPAKGESAVPDFAAPAEDRRDILQKLRDRFRAYPPRMQLILGCVILAGVYFLFIEEEQVVKKGRIEPSSIQKKDPKKDPKNKKVPGVPTFESLTPEQQAYIDSEYKIALELFKNREYDRCLLELGKIFSIVQEYKEAREVEALAREKKRQLDAQEEERKRKELERQAQMKLQALIDQAGHLMDQKKYKEAEEKFPEIELLQPENTVVAAWRKRIIEENEAIEKAREEAEKLARKMKELEDEYQAAHKTLEEKNYFAALDQLDAFLTRDGLTAKLVGLAKADIRKAEDAIAAERDPLIETGKRLEKEENYTDAYKAYFQASKVDPTDNEAPAGMNRIRGVLTNRAKGIYSEAVIAESFSDFGLAEKKYREVLEVVPVDHEYFTKASLRIKRLLAMKRLSGEGGSSDGSAGAAGGASGAEGSKP